MKDTSNIRTWLGHHWPVSLRAGPTKSSNSCSVHSGASLGKVNVPEAVKLATAGPTCWFQDKCCLSVKKSEKICVYIYIYYYNEWCSTLHDNSRTQSKLCIENKIKRWRKRCGHLDSVTSGHSNANKLNVSVPVSNTCSVNWGPGAA